MKRWIQFPLQLIFRLLILSPLAMLWGLVVALRSLAFDMGWIKVRRLPKPVISVGNISVGGSGKTPVVLELMRMFSKKKLVVLSRGYGSQVAKKSLYPQEVTTDQEPQKFGDEPSMIKARFPHQRVVLDSRRHRGGMWALGHHDDVDAFILDDGFQHRYLHRDINILVFDVNRFLQSPGLMPLGRLREPLASLRRADHVFLSKWQHLSQNKVGNIKALIKRYTKAKVSLIHTQVSGVRNSQSESLASSYDGALLMVSALGSPDMFLRDLKRHFPKVKDIIRADYPDHHSFTAQDVQKRIAQAQELDAQIVCTQKDYIKIKRFEGAEKFYVVGQSLDIPEETLFLISEEIFKEVK